MNFIEEQIKQALGRQAAWEAFDIPKGTLNRLAESVRMSLGLSEFECDGERWWSTRIYTTEEP